MSVEIRPARASDLGALMAIEEAAFATDRMSRRSYARVIASPTAAVLVAEESGAVAGSCVVLWRRNSRRARLYSIAASPGRSGVGRVLLAAAEAAASARGLDFMHLEVREDNRRAAELYRRAGYEPAGRVADYYEDGMAALRFAKRLPQRAGKPAYPPLAAAGGTPPS